MTRKAKRFDVVDFFSGCGGMSYGFHRVGKELGVFRPVGAIDIDVHANATFERNLDITPAAFDISTVSRGRILDYLRSNGHVPGNPLIVVGCAPCQGFSSHRKKDPRRDVRNSLVARFADIAVALDAEVIVMEN